jgi:diguanylate cyclase (GGDEF)-like protein
LIVDRDLYQAQLALERVIWATDPVDLRQNAEEYIENINQTNDILADLPALVQTREFQRLQQAHQNEREVWEQTARGIIEAAGQPGFETARAQHLRAVTRQFFTMRTAFDRIVDELLQPRIAVSTEQLNDQVRKAELALGIALIAALFLASWLSFAGVTTVRKHHIALIGEKEVRDRESQHKEFDRRVRRAMELSITETDTLDVICGAVEEVFDESYETEILLADAGMGHLQRAAATRCASVESGCKVSKPHDCPAIRRNTAMHFPSASTFEACPYHKRRSADDRSAVCVPVSIMGRSMGVLHALGPAHQLPNPEQLNALTAVVGAAGDEIGLLRAFATKDRQANTDALTGLLNRRSLELEVATIVSQNTAEYSIIFADMDQFKKLNDTHGHDTGDRALRMFADALRATLRPGDFSARWGGEEFVAVLPGSSGPSVVSVIERIRSNLKQRLAGGGLPHFTVSFGVSDSLQYSSFNAILNAADDALLQAKREGRDCIVYRRTAAAGKVDEEIEPALDEGVATQDSDAYAA